MNGYIGASSLSLQSMKYIPFSAWKEKDQVTDSEHRNMGTPIRVDDDHATRLHFQIPIMHDAVSYKQLDLHLFHVKVKSLIIKKGLIKQEFREVLNKRLYIKHLLKDIDKIVLIVPIDAFEPEISSSVIMHADTIMNHMTEWISEIITLKSSSKEINELLLLGIHHHPGEFELNIFKTVARMLEQKFPHVNFKWIIFHSKSWITSEMALSLTWKPFFLTKTRVLREIGPIFGLRSINELPWPFVQQSDLAKMLFLNILEEIIQSRLKGHPSENRFILNSWTAEHWQLLTSRLFSSAKSQSPVFDLFFNPESLNSIIYELKEHATTKSPRQFMLELKRAIHDFFQQQEHRSIPYMKKAARLLLEHHQDFFIEFLETFRNLKGLGSLSNEEPTMNDSFLLGEALSILEEALRHYYFEILVTEHWWYLLEESLKPLKRSWQNFFETQLGKEWSLVKDDVEPQYSHDQQHPNLIEECWHVLPPTRLQVPFPWAFMIKWKQKGAIHPEIFITFSKKTLIKRNSDQFLSRLKKRLIPRHQKMLVHPTDALQDAFNQLIVSRQFNDHSLMLHERMERTQALLEELVKFHEDAERQIRTLLQYCKEISKLLSRVQTSTSQQGPREARTNSQETITTREKDMITQLLNLVPDSPFKDLEEQVGYLFNSMFVEYNTKLLSGILRRNYWRFVLHQVGLSDLKKYVKEQLTSFHASSTRMDSLWYRLITLIENSSELEKDLLTFIDEWKDQIARTFSVHVDERMKLLILLKAVTILPESRLQQLTILEILFFWLASLHCEKQATTTTASQLDPSEQKNVQIWQNDLRDAIDSSFPKISTVILSKMRAHLEQKIVEHSPYFIFHLMKQLTDPRWTEKFMMKNNEMTMQLAMKDASLGEIENSSYHVPFTITVTAVVNGFQNELPLELTVTLTCPEIEPKQTWRFSPCIQRRHGNENVPMIFYPKNEPTHATSSVPVQLITIENVAIRNIYVFLAKIGWLVAYCETLVEFAKANNNRPETPSDHEPKTEENNIQIDLPEYLHRPEIFHQFDRYFGNACPHHDWFLGRSTLAHVFGGDAADDGEDDNEDEDDYLCMYRCIFG